MGDCCIAKHIPTCLKNLLYICHIVLEQISNNRFCKTKLQEMGNIVMPPSADTITKRVQFLAENYPDRELFVFYRGETRDPYTSQQLFQLAGKFAHRLRHQYGFQRNDIIANTIPNSPERLITDLGITLAGCTCMNGQILLADGSDFFLSARNSRCRGVILRPEDDSPAWRLLKPYVTGDVTSGHSGLSYSETPDMTSVIFVSRKTDRHRRPLSLLEDLRSSKDEVFVDTTPGPGDLLIIFTTSGSTGYSKLIHKTHAEVGKLSNGMDFTNTHFPTQDELVAYSDRLLGWGGGYPFTTYSTGQKRVLMDSFDSHGGKRGEAIWKAICKEKCDMAVIFALELDHVLRYVESIGGTQYKVKIVASGAQPLKRAQLEGMLTLADKVLALYGSTEVAPIAMGIVESANVDDFFCGKPLPDVQLKIVNHMGDNCKPRQTGTIYLKAEGKFRGYFNRLVDPDPNTVKCFTKDGWFDTEDIGYLDEDGNVYVMGRNKDTITYGSSVFYPGWLEAKIMQHPDIAEAWVLPVSDPVLYQNICACVKRKAGSDLNEAKLEEYCGTLFLADLENDLTPMPKFFLVKETFPETASGKTDKQALIRMVEQKFGTHRPRST